MWLFPNVKEDYVSFFFRHDAANIAAKPEIYCGSDATLPDGYDQMGTRHRCLKKGIGTGMVLPNEQRDKFLAKVRAPSTEKVYCGNADVLPATYTRNGTILECFKKGVGVGLGMPQERRYAVQNKPARLGKKALTDLAIKFKIDYKNLTREQTVQELGTRIQNVALP